MVESAQSPDVKHLFNFICAMPLAQLLIGYNSDLRPLTNLKHAFIMTTFLGSGIYFRKTRPKLSLMLMLCSPLYSTYNWIQNQLKKEASDLDHGNQVLRVFYQYSQCDLCDAYKFKELPPHGGKIFGFSISGPGQIYRLEHCASFGIVVIALGNDGKNALQEVEFGSFPRLNVWKPQNLKRMIFVGSYDSHANYITEEQQKSGFNYVKAPFVFNIDGKEMIGTSLGQPYVSALLYQCMKKVPDLSPEQYIDALMRVARLKEKALYNFEEALSEMQKILVSLKH